MTIQEQGLLIMALIFTAFIFDSLDRYFKRKTLRRNAGAFIKDKNGEYKRYKF